MQETWHQNYWDVCLIHKVFMDKRKNFGGGHSYFIKLKWTLH